MTADPTGATYPPPPEPQPAAPPAPPAPPVTTAVGGAEPEHPADVVHRGLDAVRDALAGLAQDVERAVPMTSQPGPIVRQWVEHLGGELLRAREQISAFLPPPEVIAEAALTGRDDTPAG